jgi:hypothetical protein
MRSLSPKYRHALVVVGGIAGYALFGLILWWLLDSYIDPNAAPAPSNAAPAPSSISTAKKDLMQAWSFVMAGVAGVIGIYFTWQNLKHTQHSTQDTLEITKRGQDTERFTRAVDQLGHDKSEVRIGGIYALERIAEESKEHYWPVIEVITSYIRTHATQASV